MTVELFINGAGRLGREVIRQALNNSYSINGINLYGTNPEAFMYLLQYDSTYYGKNGFGNGHIISYESSGPHFVIDGKACMIYNTTDVTTIPASAIGNCYVIECTGTFNWSTISDFMTAGFKGVVAPYYLSGGPSEEMYTIPGIQSWTKQYQYTSCGDANSNAVLSLIYAIHSSTTLTDCYYNILSPYNSINNLRDYPLAYTSGADKQLYKGAGNNIIPYTNNDTLTIVQSIVRTNEGINAQQNFYTAIPASSVINCILKLPSSPTATDVGEIIKAATEGTYKGYIGYTTDPICSIDTLGENLNVIIPTPYIQRINGSDGYYYSITGFFDETAGLARQAIEAAIQMM